MRSEEPLVSIITAFYNEELHLKACLKSIFDQSYSSIEVILINDGSTDASLSIAETFVNSKFKVTLITIANSGTSVAKNLGIEKAQGEFITFLDADDRFETDAIQKLVTEQKRTKSDIVICGFSMISSKNQITERKSYSIKNSLSKVERITAMLENKISETIWAKLYSTDLIKNTKLEPNVWHQDKPFTLECLCKAEHVAFFDEALLLINKNQNSTTRKSISLKRINDIIHVFECQLKILENYNFQGKKPELVNYHLLSIFDLFIFYLDDSQYLDNKSLVANQIMFSIKHLKEKIRKEKIRISMKTKIKIAFLQLPKWISWNLFFMLFKIIRNKRIKRVRELR